MKSEKLTVHTPLLFVFFICIVGMLGFTACKPREMSESRVVQIFRQYVLDPIPKSVKNIRADQPGIFYGRTYTLRFNINRADLDLITNSRPFIKIWDVKYKKGGLYWGWDRVGPPGPVGIPKYGLSMSLYEPGNEPAWFRPELWDDPEAYGLYKIGELMNTEAYDRYREKSSEFSGRKTIQVLLYNEKDGEAYFIASSHPRP